ncbi:MAG TPA: hypothetical protein VHI52_17630 [Verrucomicrobiae bacterium]|nr:hypothetical protein [Verrucomicrobiae bacterium]
MKISQGNQPLAGASVMRTSSSRTFRLTEGGARVALGRVEKLGSEGEPVLVEGGTLVTEALHG